MDGSQKMPQRMIGTLNDLAKRGMPAPKMVEAFATWIKYLQLSNSINDPLGEKLKPLATAKDLRGISAILATPFDEIYDGQLLAHLN
jgi:fructuronate reductase